MQDNFFLIYIIEKQLEKADFDMLKLACSNTFPAFLDEAQKLNEELSLAKRKDPNLEDLIAVVKVCKPYTAGLVIMFITMLSLIFSTFTLI